jgi:hypothetical protein
LQAPVRPLRPDSTAALVSLAGDERRGSFAIMRGYAWEFHASGVGVTARRAIVSLMYSLCSIIGDSAPTCYTRARTRSVVMSDVAA